MENPQKIVTRQLQQNELRLFASELLSFLERQQIDVVEVMCGWGCEMNLEEMWKPIALKTNELLDFLTSIQKDGLFQLGSSDLHIKLIDGTGEFKLCHESDVHFSGAPRLLTLVRRNWKELDFKSIKTRPKT